MNRYVRDGLVSDLLAGKTVLLIAESRSHARLCLERLEEALPASPGIKVRRSNGEEGIRAPQGGALRILSQRSDAIRGLQAEVVFVDADVTPERLAAIRLCAMAGGELILR